MSKIDGVNSDELIVNEKGGSQSYTPYAFHLMDAPAMFALARVLEEGARKHAPDNWRKIAPEDHFNHLVMHIMAWKAGDKTDDHLGHGFARMMMLFATAQEVKE